jgi:hypothetical protein
MVHEREKRAILEPLHRKACDMPALNISQQNLLYYASLANFYTVYDLRNLKPEQTCLYLLCYSDPLSPVQRQPGGCDVFPYETA